MFNLHLVTVVDSFPGIKVKDHIVHETRLDMKTLNQRHTLYSIYTLLDKSLTNFIKRMKSNRTESSDSLPPVQLQF